MHCREQSRRERDQWVICLAAVAQMVEQLPLLYRVVESGEDDIRVELHVKSSCWEILQINPAGQDHVAVAVSGHLDNIEALDADLQWAASRPCSEQASELLSALVRIRGSILQGIK